MARKDLLTGLSLANLCFISLWAQLSSLTSGGGYLLRATNTEVQAAILNVACLGVTFAAFMSLVRRVRHTYLNTLAALGLLGLVAVIIPLDVFRLNLTMVRVLYVVSWIGAGRWYWAIPPLALLVVAAYCLFRWHSGMARSALLVVRLLVPFAPITIGGGIWLLLHHDLNTEFRDGPLAGGAPSNIPSAARLVIIVFDEVDERLAFVERPAGVSLPEFDRLRGESLSADSAYSPGGSTDVSLPGLTTGRIVDSVTPVSPHTLTLHFAGTGESVKWASQPSVFSRAHLLGRNVGLVGWFHPYCRLFNQSLSRCFWEPFYSVKLRGESQSLPRTMLGQIASLSPWAIRVTHIRMYEETVRRAQEMVADRTLQLVFLHLPVPHLPPIYDPGTNQLSVHDYRFMGYFDNLMLMDRTLGAVRRAIEGAGLWETTSIVVTSDHSWRGARRYDGRSDPRVPFLVRAAGSEDSLTYLRSFNTAVLADLSVAVLSGETGGARSIARWLNAHKGLSAAHH